MTFETKNLSFTQNGRRYAECIKCGNTWNIAKGQIVMSDGYICPWCYNAGKGKGCIK